MEEYIVSPIGCSKPENIWKYFKLVIKFPRFPEGGICVMKENCEENDANAGQQLPLLKPKLSG